MRTVLAFLLVVSFAALVAGCGAPSATDVLKNTAAAYKNAKTIAMEEDIRNEMQWGKTHNSQAMSGVLRFERPDKMRMEVSGQGMRYVLMCDGKKTYMYDNQTRTWRAFPKQVAKSAFSLPGVKVLTESDPFKGVKNAKVIGSENVGGVDTYVVQFDMPNEMKMKGTYSGKLWVGKKDWLIRKSESAMKMDMGGPSSGGSTAGRPTGSMSTTMTVVMRKIQVNSRIDPALFSPPKNVKVTPLQMPSGGG